MKKAKDRHWTEPKPIRTMYTKDVQIMESFEVVEVVDLARFRVLSRQMAKAQRRARRKANK